MTFSTVLFYILAFVAIVAASRVVLARSPVVAALHLMLTFFTASMLWILIGAEYLGLLLIIIYVGAVMVMFGAVAASGINILASIQLDRRALLIVAISLALGLGVAQVPQILEHLPELFKNIFSSGVATGGIAALILNIVLPETHK